MAVVGAAIDVLVRNISGPSCTVNRVLSSNVFANIQDHIPMTNVLPFGMCMTE
jgi:hypothetical protein